MHSFGRVVDQRWTTSGGTTADRFGYAYDRDSNQLYKENLVSASNSELYSYDNLNQLSSFQRGTLNGTKTGLTGSASRSQSWDFDALGNFDSQTTDGTTQTRTTNKQNEITSISGATTPTYDSNGNLTKDETGRTFTYDAWNRLATVKDSGGTLLATYKWDGQGHRVREIRGSTTTDLYYSDKWQVLEERVGGVAKFSYAWSPVYVDAMIARDRDTDANGTLDERLYAVQDANFNVTALVNTSGTVVERYQYDPFGKFNVLDGSWASRGSSSFGWNYLHQGGRWDADGGVYSFRNRELSPTLGRWLQLDPIGFAARDENLYRAYKNNSPKKRDASGLDVDLNLFPKGDELRDNAKKIARPFLQKCFIVVGHGSQSRLLDEDKKNLTPEELLAKIKAHPNFQKGSVIYLYSCNSGKGTDNYAQKLADAYGFLVCAPTTYLGIGKDGSLVIADLDKKTDDFDLNRKGRLELFEPKKK